MLANRKNILLILISLIVSIMLGNYVQASETCKDWKPQWSKCSVNSDCVVVANPCWWPTSASNQISFKIASNCNRIAGAAISCASWNETDKNKRIVVCESGQCQNKLQIKKTEK